MSDHLQGEERKKKAREHFIDNQVARLSKPLANTTKTKEEIREEEEKKFEESTISTIFLTDMTQFEFPDTFAVP